MVEIVEYNVKLRAQTISENVRLNDVRYGGWKAINIGTSPATVYGVELQPSEGLEFELQPSEHWTEPIDITLQAGGKVRLLRKLCTPYIVKVYK